MDKSIIKNLIEREVIDYAILTYGKSEDEIIFIIKKEQFDSSINVLNNEINEKFIFGYSENMDRILRDLKRRKDINGYKIISKDPIEKEYNRLYNEEDLKDHTSVGLCILDLKKQKVLVLDHIKYNMITIPVGKAKDNESPFEAICNELKEETNIDLFEATELARFNKGIIKNDKLVMAYNHLFITTTDLMDMSDIKNMEPHKHRKIFWISLKELENLETKSFMTIVFQDILKNKYIKIDKKDIIIYSGNTNTVQDMKYTVL